MPEQDTGHEGQLALDLVATKCECEEPKYATLGVVDVSGKHEVLSLNSGIALCCGKSWEILG